MTQNHRRGVRMPCRQVLPLVSGMAMLLALAAYWFLFGVALDHADPLRHVVGACVIFLLPGLVAGELVGLRAASPLETIAFAFAASCGLEIILLAVVCSVGGDIGAWVGLLLTVTAIGLLVVTAALLGGLRSTFLSGLLSLPQRTRGQRFLYIGLAVVPLLLGALAYCWGEDVTDLGGEKYLHLTFVRYYREMPLLVANLGIERDRPPPNLIHFWEFLVAAWAACVRIDPLPVFAHARMVVPVLGLAGMYLLIRGVFVRQRQCLLVFAGVLLLCIGQAVLELSMLRFITAHDATRGVFAFLGSAHHADSAMDILLPLTAGIGLWFLRRPRLLHALLLAAVLATNFLWHAREFLQAALYIGMLGPTALLMPSLRRRVVFRRWLAAFGIVVGTAALTLVISSRVAPRPSSAYDESALKRTAVWYALEPRAMFTVRNLFHYPMHLLLSGPLRPDRVLTSDEVYAALCSQRHYDRWLLMAATATILLTLLGGAGDRRLAIYHLLLWLVAYCWNFSMLLIMALTYTEFFMVTPRLLYLFSYLVIAQGAVIGGTAVYRAAERALCSLRPSWTLVASVVVLALVRFGLPAWLNGHERSAARLAVVLSTGCFALLPAVFWCDRQRWQALHMVRALSRPLPIGLCLVLVGMALMPGNAREASRLVARACTAPANEPDWFGDANPFDYSRALIGWARALPAGHRLASNPLDAAMLSVYTPQYLCVQPVISVIAGAPERALAKAGQHPFYWPHPADGRRAACTVEHQRAVRWLIERQADYVLLNSDDYDGPALAYFQAHPECYEPVFVNSAGREAVFRVRNSP